MGRPALLPPPGASGGDRVPAITRLHGACTPDSAADFFDEDTPEPALTLCRACHVRPECLAYALEHEKHGIWGGTLPDQRKEMRGDPLPHTVEQRRHADLIRSRLTQGWSFESVAGAETVNERTLKRWREHPDQSAAA